MYQYRLCLGALTIAVLSVGMILDRLQFAAVLFAGLFSWYITLKLIPKISQLMLKANVFGYDINKKGSKLGQKKIPECVGFACAVSFIVIGLLYHAENLEKHYAIMISIIGTVLLGFADDMIDLQWRYKLIFPLFLSLPIVHVFNGSTSIWVPYPFDLLIGSQINLSYLFYVYITLLGIYCTNTINIYAGINGLQVGQSIITACSQLILFSVRAIITGQFHLYSYSSFILITFLGTALALMKYNAYPSQVFVGDTFCYFSGIVLATSAIFSQTSIIIQFLLIPQLINFLYSVPQLFGFYQCPRHRLPKYNINQDKLQSIPTNMNLLNLSLRILGPTNENTLGQKLLIFQIITSVFGILLGTYFI